nr:putative ribonuclease H-like domain-containing protein [Tanacetum cinerariifolium]
MVAILENGEFNTDFHPMVDFIAASSLRPDIMFAVCTCARHQVTPKECHLHAVKRIFRYLKGHPKLGLWYPKESPFDLVAYSDSDYGGATQDRKSTTRGCQFLGRRLISWQCKKQTIVATSTTEAEYVTAAICCAQVLWIQNQLLDYGYNFMNTKIYIDNNSAICIVKNPVYHSKTKHIEIRHHFIIDCFEKKLISVDHIHTDENVADLLTKPFDAERFQYLVTEHNADFHPMVDFIEASPLRRNLKPQDEEGISSLPDTKLFENLTLMRYNISPNQKLTFQKDEPDSPLRDVSQGEACPTDFGFIADQARATIAKPSTLPYDLAPRTQEVEINRLKDRVKLLEDRDGVDAIRSGDDAPIKGRSMDEGEAATKRISDDSKEMATVLTSMDAGIILASGVVDVLTGSGSIPTASTPAEEQVPTGSDVVPTTSPVFATATVVARELEEQLEREDQRRSEQIARDAKIARIHAEEELQIMINGLDRNNETVAKYLHEYHQFALELPMERRIELITDLNKNLMDLNIDALYNILKQNQGDVNDAMGSKKKTVVVTSDPLALITEKIKVSKSKEKVVISSDSEESEVDDFSELKKITALL